VTEPEALDDPRAMDDEELAKVPEPPAPDDASVGSEAVVEDEFAQGQTSDPEGANRDVPAGEDYAGSGL
jgi:hypothetical protein